MSVSVLASAARTPVGKLGGSIAALPAVDLGGAAIGAALERAGIPGDQVDSVVMGQVLQAGQGQNPARQAAVIAGIPMRVPALTINKVCLSSLYALHLADLMIRTGEAQVVVAGGMESMSNTPYLLPGARAGYRMGNAEFIDALIHDGLWDAFDDVHMGGVTDKFAAEASITREDQDRFAVRSHERAATATKEGRLGAEIVAVAVPQKKGEPLLIDTDEGIRPGATLESLGKLRPAFSEQGTITAGNASQISDGAAAIVMMHRSRAKELGVRPRAELVGYGSVAGPDGSLLTQPSRAIIAALERARLSLDDVSLFEINEAFAAVALASMAHLATGHERVNVNGGAIALGHPIGMSGARLAMTLVEELNRRGGGIGAAALCGGGGQGDAMLLRVDT